MTREPLRSGDFETAEAEIEAGAEIDALTLSRVPILVERMLHRDAACVAWLPGRIRIGSNRREMHRFLFLSLKRIRT